LDVNKKKELLKNNPLLPYALIMTENEYIAISELLQEEELSQIVPVVRYNDREMVYENSLGKIQFLSSPKMMQLDPDDIDAYIQQLYEKKNDMLRELEQAEEVIHNANQEYQAVSQFQWERPEIDKLYQESRRLQDLIQELENESRDIQQQVKEKENRLEQLQIIIVDLKGKHAEAVQRKNRFNEYIQENEKYMENLREERKINDQISKVNKDIADAEKAIKSLNECLNKAESSLREEIQAKREIEGKYSAVKGASEDEPIEGSLDELEGKLQAYLSQQNNAAADIEKQIKELEKEIRREEGQIGKLGLNKEDYEGVVYSELLEKELEEKKNALEKGKQSLEKQCHKWEMEKAELEGIKKKLKEDLNGASLIPPKEILGSFDERRKKLQEQLQAKADREREIDKVNRRIAALLAKVESKIKDIMQIEAGAPFKPFHQVVNEIEPMLDQMDRILDTTNERIDSFKSRTTELKSRYDKNDISVISEALQSILRQVNGLDRSYDKYYYLSERLDSVFINLNAVLKIMEEKVRQLEHDRNDLVEHAFLEAMRIYHEIPKISENSGVEIDGVRRRILDIEYEKIQDELVAKEKMKAYIYDCLDTLKRQLKEKVEEDKVKRDLVKFISTKELLNVISSLENCNVRAYKLDINENNRKMMRWEDIIVKNSGGEKFVAYFSLLVALMSYSRGRSKELFRKAEDTKVLIMDNPFGPITSGHLLKPMFDIAKKYNTQLICLSDIKQESVINCFNLVYMIKIRQNMMRDEYLEFEPHLLTELRADEKLEKAYLHAEQIGLF